MTVPVGLVADHDEALFSPHDVKAFRPVRHCAQGFSRLLAGGPEGRAVAGGDGDLVAEFAGEADPVDPDRDARQGAVRPLHEGQRFLGHVHSAKDLQQFPRVRADDRDLGVLFGDVGGVDLPVPPFALQPVFHPGMDAVGPARGGVAKPCVLINPGRPSQ